MEETIMKMFLVIGDELCELKIEKQGKGFMVSILGGSEGEESSYMTYDELKNLFSDMQKSIDKKKAA